jgi:hypothetical protein
LIAQSFIADIETRKWSVIQSQRLRKILDSAPQPLLRALDASVTRYQADNDRTINRLQDILVGVLALMLYTLIGEAVFIFSLVYGAPS